MKWKKWRQSYEIRKRRRKKRRMKIIRNEIMSRKENNAIMAKMKENEISKERKYETKSAKAYSSWRENESVKKIVKSKAEEMKRNVNEMSGEMAVKRRGENQASK